MIKETPVICINILNAKEIKDLVNQKKELEFQFADKGLAAPAFGFPDGAIQYYHHVKIKDIKIKEIFISAFVDIKSLFVYNKKEITVWKDIVTSNLVSNKEMILCDRRYPMYEEAKVLTHSSIKIDGKQVLYFDPYEIKEESHDADFIFITHDHFDHYSPDDIKKIVKEDTLLIMPENMKGNSKDSLVKAENYHFIAPEETIELEGLKIEAIPSYNRMKPFHPKGKKNVGYLVTMGDVTYYVAGDTDVTPENQQIKCDVALVPVGGKFTMDHKEAAKLVNEIKPRLAIPTHYGSVAGSAEDGKKFAGLVDSDIEVRIMI